MMVHHYDEPEHHADEHADCAACGAKWVWDDGSFVMRHTSDCAYIAALNGSTPTPERHAEMAAAIDQQEAEDEDKYGPGGHACTCGHGDPCYDCNLGWDN